MLMPEGIHLMETVRFLQDKGYRVIYVALYGAQNYNLQREKSDYDYKAVVVPTLRDIVFNTKPISLVEELPFDGQVDVKDVRLMIDQWKKGSSNFLELLYTDWYWIAPDYAPMYWFRINRDKIAHANEESAIKAMIGMTKEKYNALRHPYPIQVDEINEFGYAAKQLSHEMRMLSMISQYKKKPYREVINPFKGNDEDVKEYYERILAIKDRKFNLLAAQADEMGKLLVNEADAWFEAYKKEGFNLDKETLDMMDEQKFAIIKRALSDELWEVEI